MGWKANAKVTAVEGNQVVLTAEGADVTFDGDDQVESVVIVVNSVITPHLTVGVVVEIESNC